MWILDLNPMRGRFEELHTVARADSREALDQYIERERVPDYEEHEDLGYMAVPSGKRWVKRFRKGGPLEWYNPPDRADFVHFRDIGSRTRFIDTAIERAGERAGKAWDQLIEEIPRIESNYQVVARAAGDKMTLNIGGQEHQFEVELNHDVLEVSSHVLNGGA